MSANAASAVDEDKDRSYNQGDVSRVTQELALELGIDFISNYAATLQSKIDGVAYTDDGLHPNDLGHRMMFENIRNAVINA
ncbi:SGNH/GDSL hydrolase family protein [Psychrobacter sp. WY6]|jgi:lysophospholipase L1-like esterase|uniref:SGNH/GDSL hydrolase family protein n=1 Tax=Psychrobacter sp. WY6 TaxID=2708350 RepID=UPI002022C4BD|nr:SGNH/GDSL hydrolase family protein [Psychrobacter sp. WY6]